MVAISSKIVAVTIGLVMAIMSHLFFSPGDWFMEEGRDIPCETQ
jgi:uncharacterized membrane protein YgaE (UPF0421/DUF939 family)